MNKPMLRLSLKTLQVNLGYGCNLACTHCHVEAGPKRKEKMEAPQIERLKHWLAEGHFEVLDLTGGAPEMHPQLINLIRFSTEKGVSTILRTNLSILLETNFQHLPKVFAEYRVHLIASMPCYLEKNVDAQRGKGVYKASVRSLQMLNELGYARNPELKLDLLYNPGGDFLAPDQQALEADYKRELKKAHGIDFNQLYTLHNFPVGRFKQHLAAKNTLDAYQKKLEAAHNEKTIPHLMCRHQVSVGPDGRLFDCDFHQMENLPILNENKPLGLDHEPNSQALFEIPIPWKPWCHACTAGQGASCGGALVTGEQ